MTKADTVPVLKNLWIHVFFTCFYNDLPTALAITSSLKRCCYPRGWLPNLVRGDTVCTRVVCSAAAIMPILKYEFLPANNEVNL